MLPESRDPGRGPWDPASVLLSLLGMFGVVYAVKQLAVHGPGPAALGAACLYGFARRQLALPTPLLDMRLFRHRGFSGAVLADLLTVLGLAGTVFFLSQFLQGVQGRSPLQASLCELPATLGAAATGLVAGACARRWSVRGAVAGGLGSTGLALVALLALRPDSGYLFLGAALLVVGAGAGLSYTVTADVILSSVPPAQAGAASGVSETAYELGAALGIALLGSIVTGISGGPASAAPAAFTDGLRAASALGGGVPWSGWAASRRPSRQRRPCSAGCRTRCPCAVASPPRSVGSTGSTRRWPSANAPWRTIRTAWPPTSSGPTRCATAAASTRRSGPSKSSPGAGRI